MHSWFFRTHQKEALVNFSKFICEHLDVWFWMVKNKKIIKR